MNIVHENNGLSRDTLFGRSTGSRHMTIEFSEFSVALTIAATLKTVAMFSQMPFPVRVFAISVAVLLLSLTLELPERLKDLYLAQQTVPESDSDASVLIIGGSHAGLSAALTLARHQIDSLIFDGNKPRNKWKTPTHTLPTWEDRGPDEIRRASRKELRKSGFAQFVQTQITTVRKPGAEQSFFEVEDFKGQTWRGRKLLLATGVDFVFPDIEGYKDNFPDRMYVDQPFLFLFFIFLLGFCLT